MPLRAASFVLLPVVAACSAPQARRDTAEHRRAGLHERLDGYLRDQEGRGFSGAVIVSVGGAVVLDKGYGLAVRERGLPCTPETVFDIGSITKQFTAAAIVKLEMEGTLRVDDPLTRHFDRVPPDKAGVTLHHLLTHTAGLRDSLGGDYAVLTREQMVELALASALITPPGQTYRYSNLGYSLLGAIVEKSGGASYERVLHEKLLRPARMEWTGYRRPGLSKVVVAHGYAGGRVFGSPLDKAWADDGPYWNLRANGGILSTTGDMLRWHHALLGEAVLSQQAKAKLFTPHVREAPGEASFYGYGWVVMETPHGTLITHNGGNGFFFADFARYVTANVAIFVVTNSGLTDAVAQIPGELARITLVGPLVETHDSRDPRRAPVPSRPGAVR